MSAVKRIVSSQSALTITLNSLANSAGRVSTLVTFANGSTTFKYPAAVLVHYQFRTGSVAPTLGQTVQFFWVRAASGSAGLHIDGNFAQTDTGYTGASSPFTASQMRDQAQLVFSQPVIASTAKDYFGSFYIFDPGPMGSLYVYNDTGQTLDTTAGNFYIRYEEVYTDIT